MFWALWQNSADDDYYIRKVILDYNLTYQSGEEEEALKGMLSDFNLNDIAYWYPTETYCYKIKYDGSKLKTYVVTAGIREWTIELSYIPEGDLYINTQYLFTTTIKMNGYVKSDIDIAIEFDKNSRKTLLDLVRIEEELTKIFGRKVDLGIFSSINPYIIEDIKREMRVIYEKR